MSDDNNNSTPDTGELAQKLNLETGRISWQELQRHFARGVVLVVSRPLDLIEVAIKLTQDDTPQFERWLAEGLLRRALDEDARGWHAADTEFWSVVVAPWVLVQATDVSTSI